MYRKVGIQIKFHLCHTRNVCRQEETSLKAIYLVRNMEVVNMFMWMFQNE